MKELLNGAYVEMDEAEVSEINRTKLAAEIAERTRPLTDEEVTALLIKQQINSLDIDDATASRMADYFPGLTGGGALVKVGTRINWVGVIKRAAVDLWDTAENTPDAAPNLWEDLEYRDGVRIIPAVITVGKAFARDELGWWGDILYRSKVDANVYTPEQYAANWEVADV